MKVINIEKFKQWLKNEQERLEQGAQKLWEKGNEMDAAEARVEANIYAFLEEFITNDTEYGRPDFVEEVAMEELEEYRNLGTIEEIEQAYYDLYG